MAVELIIAPEVEQDLAEAYAWYEARRTGLGEEFLSCVDAGIAAVCRMPEMYAAIHEQYRRRFVRRFPYAIFYEYTAGTVTVYGAVSRGPGVPAGVRDGARHPTAARRPAGAGPRFLECRTYRFRAHSMFDAELYREKTEVEAWKQRCPILTLTQRLVAQGRLSDADLAGLEQQGVTGMETDRIIAYFSMEIALEAGMPTYSGGLGVLAGDTVRAAADLHIPMVAVTLLHRQGYFSQRLDAQGWQHEEPVAWAVHDFVEGVSDLLIPSPAYLYPR